MPRIQLAPGPGRLPRLHQNIRLHPWIALRTKSYSFRGERGGGEMETERGATERRKRVREKGVRGRKTENERARRERERERERGEMKRASGALRSMLLSSFHTDTDGPTSPSAARPYSESAVAGHLPVQAPAGPGRAGPRRRPSGPTPRRACRKRRGP